jgi:hypothetical protein
VPAIETRLGDVKKSLIVRPLQNPQSLRVDHQVAAHNIDSRTLSAQSSEHLTESIQSAFQSRTPVALRRAFAPTMPAAPSVFTGKAAASERAVTITEASAPSLFTGTGLASETPLTICQASAPSFFTGTAPTSETPLTVTQASAPSIYTGTHLASIATPVASPLKSGATVTAMPPKVATLALLMVVNHLAGNPAAALSRLLPRGLNNVRQAR